MIGGVVYPFSAFSFSVALDASLNLTSFPLFCPKVVNCCST
jgi:hypothetical protein